MVTGLEVSKREVVLDGKPFGDAGAYEKIAGTIRYAADPAHALHRQITDIDRAPRNRDGLVEFSADFYLLKPVDAAKGSRRLLVDVPNRGRKVAIEIFNSTPRVPDLTAPEHFGNGFLMRHGFTVAWIGWQPDVPRQDGLMVLDAPRAKGVTGWLRTQRRPNEAADVLPLADRYHVPYATVDVNDPEARIVMRERAGAPAVEIPRAHWRFVDEGHVKLDGGFKPGAIYEFFYRSSDPTIVGLAFLAVRDVAAFLRWGPAESNPCAGALDRAYLFGVSQSGRFIRHMLHLGLDEDEQGRMVYDGVMPHVAGGRRGEFNLRFGQPSLNAMVSVGSLPPFNDEGVFARIKQRGRTPKIIATNSSPEYWRGDASLVHTDLEGRDAQPASFVRTYLFAGTQHTPTSVPPAAANASTGDRGYHPFNIVNYSPLLRCALINLDRWVSEGVEPPDSVFPRVADGTAVQGESLADTYGKIPGARFPVRLPRPAQFDFGPEIDKGIPAYPPKVGEPYRTFVSSVDADGNEVAGLRGAELAAPLATLTGWNTRHPDTGAAGDIMSMNGSTLAFPRSKADRQRTGDPRVSIEERYPTKAAYLERVREVTREAIARRHVLPEDLEAVVDRAGKTWDWIQSAA